MPWKAKSKKVRAVEILLLVMACSWLAWIGLHLLNESWPTTPELECIGYVRGVYLSTKEFGRQHGGSLPASIEEMIGGRVGEYPDPVRYILCPMVTRRLKGRSLATASDFDYLGEGLTLEQCAKPEYADVPIIFDHRANHADGSRSVAFAGGDCTLMRGRDFELLLRRAVETGRYSPGVTRAMKALIQLQADSQQ